MWREEFSDGDGNVKRRQRNVKLGSVAELPTRTAAREKIRRLELNQPWDRGRPLLP
jgi:hypothetical protein